MTTLPAPPPAALVPTSLTQNGTISAGETILFAVVAGVTQAQISWVREHRPDEPTLASARPAPAPSPAREAVHP